MKKVYINRNNLFDYVRLYAALQVLIAHGSSHLKFDLPKLISYIFSYSGVPIFFAISGFLITISWINSEFNLRKFFVSRSLRIFPALWTSAILSFLLIISFGKLKFAFSFKGFIWLLSQSSFLTFWNPNELRDFGVGVVNGSLWTIPVELQFYLLVPFLIALYISFKRKSSVFIAALCLVFISALSISINLFFPPLAAGDGTIAREGSLLIKLLYVSIAPYLGTFIIGMILALIFSIIGQKSSSVLFLGLGMFMISIDNISSINDSLSLWIYPIYTALIFIGIGLLPSPFLIGFDISYGLYLYHMLVVNLLIEINLKSNTTIIYLYFLITFLLAFASWYLIESPLLKLKAKIIRS